MACGPSCALSCTHTPPMLRPLPPVGSWPSPSVPTSNSPTQIRLPHSQEPPALEMMLRQAEAADKIPRRAPEQNSKPSNCPALPGLRIPLSGSLIQPKHPHPDARLVCAVKKQGQPKTYVEEGTILQQGSHIPHQSLWQRWTLPLMHQDCSFWTSDGV